MLKLLIELELNLQPWVGRKHPKLIPDLNLLSKLPNN